MTPRIPATLGALLVLGVLLGCPTGPDDSAAKEGAAKAVAVPTGAAAATASPAAPAAIPGSDDPTGGGAVRFGVTGGIYPRMSRRTGAAEIQAVTREIDQLGTVWMRHVGRGNAWWEVQPDRDTFDFSKHDAVFEGNQHPWIMTLYGGMGTPYIFNVDFNARTLKKKDKREVLRQIKDNPLDVHDKQQAADAQRYISTFVKRYQDRIKYWEMGNEGINAPEALDVAVATHKWVKEADPEARTLHCALAGDSDRHLSDNIAVLDGLLERGMGNSFDIGNIHYYGMSGDDLEERIEEHYDNYVAVLAKHGLTKPVWVTETSSSCNADNQLTGPSSEQQQARDVVRRLVVFVGRGAEKVMWHNYANTSVDGKYAGCNLVEKDTHAQRPAFHTLKLLLDKIGRFEQVETLRGSNIRLYRFTNPGGGVVLVAWSHEATSLDLQEYLGTAQALVTPIPEERGAAPAASKVKAKAVSVGPSPIFVEPVTP